ncbi:MAG: cysteine desulfurase NifS [Desulfobacterales bacterium]|nr:cysteine desulfurase NifS [Desulfobacterales bacterium]
MSNSGKVVYMDNNATTRVAPEVLEAMLPYFSELYGNPSSMHSFGGQVGRAVAAARQRIAGLLGAEPDELIFTSCGTESDSTAIFSALQANPGKRHIVTTRVEHPAVKSLCENLDKLTGHKHKVTQLPVDREGMLDLDRYQESLTDETAIVSVMWANNETGVIFPVEEMAAIAKGRGILFHTDAVQAVGKIAINLNEIPVDFFSMSGHKLHAPKGVGVLYVRKGTPFAPFLIGGHQEHGRRGGTENVASIIGLGRACELAAGHIMLENTRVRLLRDKLEQGLMDKIPNAILNGNKKYRLPNTSNISFEFVEGEAILLHLDRFGICASSGSACTSGSLEPSHVLRAMGVPFTAAHGSIRFSLSVYNTEDEVDFVLEKLPGIIAGLRDMSPFWKGSRSVTTGAGAGHGKCGCST